MAKKVPLRMCIGCQETKPKKEMVRIVRTPEQEFTVDQTGKKSGRGAYICPDKDCLEKAVKGKKLEKAFKQSISEDVYEFLKGNLVFDDDAEGV